MTRAAILALCFPGIVLTTLFAYPMLALVSRGALTPTQVSLWSDPLFWIVLRFTYTQAALSALVAGVIGTAGALLFSENRFRGRALFWQSSLVCFSLPSVLVVLALIGFWGKQGWLARALGLAHLSSPVGSFYGWFPILLGHAFFNFPLFLKYVGTALAGVSRAEEKVALSLGASRLTCFARFTLPKLRPALRSAFLLSFLYCSTSFLIVLMLGGGPRFTTLEVAVYQAVRIQFDLAVAVRLALVQIGLSSLVFFALFRGKPRAEKGPTEPFVALYRFQSPLGNQLALGLYFLVLFALAGGPLLSLLAGGLSALTEIARASELRHDLLHSLGQSLLLATLTACFSVATALPLAYSERHLVRFRRTVALLSSLPLFLSGVLLTVSWMTAYPDGYWRLRGSLLVVAALQSVLALPLVTRGLRDGFFRISDEMYRTCRSLGAGPWRTFVSLELPLVEPALRVGVMLAMGFSLGEVGSVLLLLPEAVATLPAWIYYRMGQYRFPEAYAGAAVLVLLIAGVSVFGREREVA